MAMTRAACVGAALQLREERMPQPTLAHAASTGEPIVRPHERPRQATLDSDPDSTSTSTQTSIQPPPFNLVTLWWHYPTTHCMGRR